MCTSEHRGGSSTFLGGKFPVMAVPHLLQDKGLHQVNIEQPLLWPTIPPEVILQVVI